MLKLPHEPLEGFLACQSVLIISLPVFSYCLFSVLSSFLPLFHSFFFVVFKFSQIAKLVPSFSIFLCLSFPFSCVLFLSSFLGSAGSTVTQCERIGQ